MAIQGHYFTRTSLTIRWYKQSEKAALRSATTIAAQFEMAQQAAVTAAAQGGVRLTLALNTNHLEATAAHRHWQRRQRREGLLKWLLANATSNFKLKKKAQHLYWAENGQEVTAGNVRALLNQIARSA